MISSIGPSSLKIIQESGIKYETWDRWNPAKYLETYFQNIGSDSYETWQFLVKELSKYKENEVEKCLDFGAGPTFFGAIPATPYVKEIHISDYLHPNLIEIRKWLNRKKTAFNWDDSIKSVLKIEGQEIKIGSVLKRAESLRRKVTKLYRCDASLSDPLGPNSEKYPLVITNFCSESATPSKEVWAIFMKNIFNLVAPGGTILVAALRNCSCYKVGNDMFPCANINENDLMNVFKQNGFSDEVTVRDVPECIKEGFSSLIFACAKKSKAS